MFGAQNSGLRLRLAGLGNCLSLWVSIVEALPESSFIHVVLLQTVKFKSIVLNPQKTHDSSWYRLEQLARIDELI